MNLDPGTWTPERDQALWLPSPMCHDVSRPHGGQLRFDDLAGLVIDEDGATNIERRNDAGHPCALGLSILDPLDRYVGCLAIAVVERRPIIHELPNEAAHIVGTEFALRRAPLEQAAEHRVSVGTRWRKVRVPRPALRVHHPKIDSCNLGDKGCREHAIVHLLAEQRDIAIANGNTMPVKTPLRPLTDT